MPRNALKFSADWRVGDGWTIGADVLAYSSRWVLGNVALELVRSSRSMASGEPAC